ncbi:MAG: response regulator [Elusimicrobiales bacterium]|nr:response regulator [Elusimicrobiales bacterium]
MPKIFLIEDEPVSAGITRRMLDAAALGEPVGEAGTLEEGLAGISASGADILLTDMGLPDSRGIETVKRVCERFPELPVIVMTGTDDEATGLEALKHGAQDYLVKGSFDHRELKRVIGYAIERKALLNEKEDLIARLKDSLKRVKLLTGLLPTCCECKKIRTPEGKWLQMETYISGHSEAVFSHGYCDDCFKRHMDEVK